MGRPATATQSGGRPSTGGATGASDAPVVNVADLLDVIPGDGSVDLDSGSGIGRFGDETAIILSAKVEKRVWTKDGELMDQETYPPETVLAIEFQRDLTWEDNNPVISTQRYAFGRFSIFGPSEDGERCLAQPAHTKAYGREPKVYSSAAAMCFVRSLKDAGFDTSVLAKEGFSSLAGLKVFVTYRKDSTMKENWKPIILVDEIEGVDESVKADGGTQTDSSDATETAFATVAALIGEAGGSIAKTKIPQLILKDADLKLPENKETRTEILRLLRDKSFIENSNAPWTFNDGTLTAK